MIDLSPKRVKKDADHNLIKLKISYSNKKNTIIKLNSEQNLNGETKSKEIIEKDIKKIQANNMKNQISLSYSDILIPLHSNIVIKNNRNITKSKAPYSGEIASDIKEESIALINHFDLPLSFRRQLKEGKSFSRLKKISNDQIIIEFITGNPTIRAALYETFLETSSFKQLHNIFSMFNTNTIDINVDFTTQFAPYKFDEFEIKNKIFNNEILIQIVKNIGIPQYGINGLAIEDEHSRKAQKKERMHTLNIMNSTAYKYSIRNKMLYR